MLSIGNQIFKIIQDPDPYPDHDQNLKNLKEIASKLWPVEPPHTNKQTNKQKNIQTSEPTYLAK